MSSWDRKRKSLIIGLFVTGIILLIIGAFQFAGFNIIEWRQTIEPPKTTGITWEYNDSFKYLDEDVIVTIEYKFTTNDVFAIDNDASVYITSTFTKPNTVEGIAFVHARPHEKISNFITGDMERGLEKLNQHGMVFVSWPVKEDNTVFVYRTDSFKPVLKGEFTLIPVIYKNGIYFNLTQTKTLFEVELAISKLQTDSIHETQIFNNYVLGLTWIMVALVLIGFSLEAFIQRYFFFNTKN